jgi:hypothetical protein
MSTSRSAHSVLSTPARHDRQPRSVWLGGVRASRLSVVLASVRSLTALANGGIESGQILNTRPPIGGTLSSTSHARRDPAERAQRNRHSCSRTRGTKASSRRWVGMSSPWLAPAVESCRS